MWKGGRLVCRGTAQVLAQLAGKRSLRCNRGGSAPLDSSWVLTVLLAGLFPSLCRVAWAYFSCVLLPLRLLLLLPLVPPCAGGG